MRVFGKLMLPSGLSLIPVVKSETSNNIFNDKKLLRPSELPLYFPNEGFIVKSHDRAVGSPLNAIDSFFGTIRTNAQDFMKNLNNTTEMFNDVMKIGIEHSQSTLDSLRDEGNFLPQIGAVTFGGLSGYIFGLRGGKFKRISYATIAAITVAAICYPKEAKDALNNTNHYVNIIYNFVYGVKPGDTALEIKWPDIDVTKISSSLYDMINFSPKNANTESTTKNSINKK